VSGAPDAEDAADLLDGLAQVERFADVGGGAMPLALAVLARWDCAVDLIDLKRSGGFADTPSDWVAPYIAALRASGADAARIRVVSREADLKPADLIANVRGFGDRHKVKHLEPVLRRCLHADSRMVMDIRKGSRSSRISARHRSCPNATRTASG
jgi:hypothetical protein